MGRFVSVMKVTRAKSCDQVKRDFMRRGESISAWANRHGFSRTLVSDILSGRRKCLRGESHRAAVMLGVKVGQVDTNSEDQ